MHFTPVVPPYPSPGGGTASPLNPPPPVIPQHSPGNPPITPAWAQQGHQFPAQSPYYMPGNFGATPNSYLIPPMQLPGGQTPLVGQGLSADYTGFPQGLGGATPYTRPGMHPSMSFPPAGSQTGYSNFQQPLPPYGYQMPPPIPMGTPYIPAVMPGGMPPMGGMGGMGGMPGMMPPGMGGMPMGGAYPYTPGPIPGGAPMPGAPPMQQSSSRQSFSLPKEKGPWDQLDKFLEGEDYGPVLKPVLVHRMKCKVELNPLIQPPSETSEHDYLKWNMLFPTGNCQRSNDRPGRSWHSGREAPATWPRVTSIRLVSRSFPWTIDIPATNPAVGVTCGDVIEAIHAAMYIRLSQSQFDGASRQQKRLLSESFYHNRSTAHGVPGGRLQQTLLRCDWLGQDTMFGGAVQDEALVRELCRSSLPCTFVLLCVKRYPMTEAEIREQEERERQEEERYRRRSRSRATSRTASTRAPTRPPSRAPPDDTSSTAS